MLDYLVSYYNKKLLLELCSEEKHTGMSVITHHIKISTCFSALVIFISVWIAGVIYNSRKLCHMVYGLFTDYTQTIKESLAFNMSLWVTIIDASNMLLQCFKF